MTHERREWRVPPRPSDEEVAEPGSYLRSVVRVFPDYADTVLWFVNGPVAYEDANLTDALVADMRAWEDAYYAGIGVELKWKSEDLEVHHYREGLRLARALADELGDSFEVEVSALGSEHDVYKLRMHGREQGTNQRAVTAFKEWSTASEAEEEYFRKLKAGGGSVGWTAYSPTQKSGG